MYCPHCGKPLDAGAIFCQYCGKRIAPAETTVQTYAPNAPMPGPQAAAPVCELQKPEKVLPGIIGALLGAALGGGSIILFSRLGLVSAISGLILAFCTLKGYELLGKRLSTGGIVFCIVLMLITPYLADRLDWAILVVEAWSDAGVSLLQAFLEVPTLIKLEYIEEDAYMKNLLILYLFVVLGAAGTLFRTIRKK